MKQIAIIILLAGLTLSACGHPATSTPVPVVVVQPTEIVIPEPTGPLQLTSPAFQDEGEIAVQYGEVTFEASVGNMTFTCTNPAQSLNVAPPLSWTNVPVASKSLVLIMVDQLEYAYTDSLPGQVFVHWVVFNIPPTSGRITSGLLLDPPATDGTLQGSNDYPAPYDLGYGGPCPGADKHLYIFTLYALDTLLDLPGGSDRLAVEAAMQGHILEQAELSAYFTGE
jgi:Raf kinase inhibitor-like YbhB/YbcL family protein